MVPVLLSILVLSMYHPADIFVNQMKIAEYAISLLPTGSNIRIGFVAHENVGLFDSSKEEYVNSRFPVLKHFNFESYAFYINASCATFNCKQNFKGSTRLPQIRMIIGSESRVIGDLTGIKELKKKTYVVVDPTSPSKGLADLATCPNHVFSPLTFDANRFSNLFNNDYENKPMIHDVFAETSTPSYPEPIYFHDNRRLSRTITIELPIALLIIAVIVLLVFFSVVRPKVVRKWFQNVLALCFDCIASFLSPISHRLFDDPSHGALFDDFSDDELAFA